MRARLSRLAARRAQVDSAGSFKSARARLAATAYDLLVTDARLSEYNGIHLVYLAKFTSPLTRAIVYDKDGDLRIAASVHRAGAFFEIVERLLTTLPSYVASPLPSNDRRTAAVFDRRMLPRGGRRLADGQTLTPAPLALC